MDPAAFQQLQADLQAAQAQIQALQAAQAQQQPPPGPFALTPALAMQNTIDYSTSTGVKVYKAGIAPLPTLFDGSTANLSLFLTEVESRANENGWNGILMISDQDPHNPTNRNLTTQHHMLTLENVQNAAHAYLGQPT